MSSRQEIERKIFLKKQYLQLLRHRKKAVIAQAFALCKEIERKKWETLQEIMTLKDSLES